MDNDLKSIYLELGSKLDKIDCLMLDDIANQIVQADKVYCYGCGRSGMSLQTFSMRIMHLGKKSYYVHDTCVPPIGENDLLIAASGSGNTKSTLAVVECATHVNAKTILITGNNNSEIAKIAGSIIYIPIDEFESIQYQGNCYDEAQFILQDTIIYKARNILNLSRADMDQNHTNIE